VLTIVSTRSYTELGELASTTFGNLTYRTARRAQIQQALIDSINRSFTVTKEIQDSKVIEVPLTYPTLKVLVVDDNEINLRLAEIILKKNNYDVTTICSGEDSIELVKHNEYDLIFMDLHMPGLDGYEAAKRIRSIEGNKHRSVIIALTANAMPQDIAKIKSCDIDDILIKPISEQLIRDIISEWFSDIDTRPVENTADDVTSDSNEIFSLDHARRLANGNEALAIELFNMLINELPDHRSEILRALSENNLHQLKEVTHKLNGASRCSGTIALSYAANSLESSINTNESEQITKKTGALVKEIDRLLEYKLPSESRTSG
jgi:two-component system sensor histidine kinase BarA